MHTFARKNRKHYQAKATVRKIDSDYPLITRLRLDVTKININSRDKFGNIIKRGSNGGGNRKRGRIKSIPLKGSVTVFKHNNKCYFYQDRNDNSYITRTSRLIHQFIVYYNKDKKIYVTYKHKLMRFIKRHKINNKY